MSRNAEKSPAAAIALTDDDLATVAGGHGGPPPGHLPHGPKPRHGGPPWYQPSTVTVGTLVQIAGGDATIDF